MLDFYMDLPAWLRTVLAIVVLGIGATMAFLGSAGRPQVHEEVDTRGRLVRVETETPGSQGVFRVGIVLTGLGAVLLCVCGRSSSEKNGYNF